MITNGGSLSPTDISRKIFRTKYAVTFQIDSLVKMGLVRRRQKNSDRRSKVVTITKKGLELMKLYSKRGQNRYSKDIFSNLDKEEIMALSSIMYKIRNQFDLNGNFKAKSENLIR